MPITINIPAGSESWDSETNEFHTVEKDTSITLEHSLVSMHKWEQKWHVGFLDERHKKTPQELVDYLRCMTLTKNVDPYVYYSIPRAEMHRVEEYIQNPMTATKLNLAKKGSKRATELKTAEVIYSDMIYLGIPFECRKWHLNALLMLIAVCNEKQTPQKQLSRSEILAQNRALNAARRATLHSRG